MTHNEALRLARQYKAEYEAVLEKDPDDFGAKLSLQSWSHQVNELERHVSAEKDSRETLTIYKHLLDQIRFSTETFGPGPRTQAVLDHMEKEIEEVRAAPHVLEEWIDLVLLALDGAWRCQEHLFPYERALNVVKMIQYKMKKNKAREWPDWRTADPNKAITHKK